MVRIEKTHVSADLCGLGNAATVGVIFLRHPLLLTCVWVLFAPVTDVCRSWVSSPGHDPLSLFLRMAVFIHAGPRVTGDAQFERRPWEGWLRPDGWIAPALCPWEPWKLKACG